MWDVSLALSSVSKVSMSSSSMLNFRLYGHTGEVRSVCYSPDGLNIISGSEDQTIYMWDAHEGNQLMKLEGGHKDAINCVNYSPSGKSIVSGGADKLIVIWDAATGHQKMRLDSCSYAINCVAYSPDGLSVLAGSNNKVIWDLSMPSSLSREKVITKQGHTNFVTCVAFSPDGELMISGGADSSIVLWNRDGMFICRQDDHVGVVSCVAFSCDGKLVISR